MIGKVTVTSSGYDPKNGKDVKDPTLGLNLSDYGDQLPAVDGHYWWRGDAQHQGGVVRVKGDRVYQHGLEHTLSIQEMGGQWAGPLREPS